MESSNPGMQVSMVGDTEVLVKLGDDQAGTYKLEFDQPKRELRLFSPRDMQTHSYRYDRIYDAWMNVEDEHNMLELLMRQLTSSCNGYPKF